MSNPFEDDFSTSDRPSVEPASSTKVVTTLKGGTGYDAPWIVVHTDTVAEAKRILSEEVKSLMDLTAEAGKYFSGKSGGASSSPAKSAPAAQQDVPDRQLPPADFPELPEGWRYESKISRSNGNVYHRYVSPDGKTSRFVNRNSKTGEYFLSQPKS